MASVAGEKTGCGGAGVGDDRTGNRLPGAYMSAIGSCFDCRALRRAIAFMFIKVGLAFGAVYEQD